MGIDIPDTLIQLGKEIGTRSPNTGDAYNRFHLDHCENIARRLADKFYFEGSIEDELASTGNPFRSAILIQTYLVAYLGATKSFLDAIANCLDSLYSLGLSPVNKDLCRPALLDKLSDKDAGVATRYTVHSAFFEDVRDWRNAAQHNVSPMVMVHGPTSARSGRSPSEIPRNEVSIKMSAAPKTSGSDLTNAPSNVQWTEPNVFFLRWQSSLDELLKLICEDIISNCPSA